MKPTAKLFAAYVESVGGRAAAAKLLNISEGMVGHIITGRRGVSVPIAMLVHEQTNGLISRARLRPDIWGDEKIAA